MLWTSKRSRDPLDETLFEWRKGEPFTIRNLLESVAVFGRTGSAKTSATGRVVGQAVVNHPNSSGLIAAAKPEDADDWRKIFRNANRSKDLLEFDAEGSPHRFNFLNEAMRHGGDAREITRCLTVIEESLRPGSQGGVNEKFWQEQKEVVISTSANVLKLAKGYVSVPDMQTFIGTAAFSRKQLGDPTWRQGFHCRTVQAAYLAPKTAIEAHDFDLSTDFCFRQLPNMDDRTRSNVLAGVLGVYHVYNSGIVRELVSTTSSFALEDLLEQRKWLLVNVPPSRYGDQGRLINAGFKYLMQRCVLRRKAKPSDAFHVIFCDEAQEFVNSHDHVYVAQSRSHLGSVVFLTQSLHSYLAAGKGPSSEHDAKSLLSNFGHVVFHACDVDTAHWASLKVGNRLETFLGGSMQSPENILDELMGRQQFTTSFSTNYAPILQPSVFMNGLRTGGPRNGFLADLIVVKSGEPFRCGQNHLQVTFSQR